ncbi:LlaJI family restriction endonuclease [Lactobacillus kunkeei]|nr:LlaJI family restriction endonuclease [Apilactobacillus kunkeei]
MLNYSEEIYTNEGKVVPESNVNLSQRDTKIIDTVDGEKKVLNFTGIVIQDNKILVSFPKNYQFSKEYIKQDIGILFKTIMKHYGDNQDLYYNKYANLKTNFPFKAFFGIYKYYQKYGIYHKDFFEENNGYTGNICWKDTINNSTKMISKNGILFLPFKIKKLKKKNVLISECMAYAIDYTINIFQSFLELKRVGGDSLKKNLLDNSDFIVNELYSLKQTFFKDIHKKLISDLIDFFQQISSFEGYYLKHYTFSSVWEKIVENYLRHHFVGVYSEKLIFDNNKNVFKDFKKISFNPNKAKPNENIQPDHYLVEKNKQFIFDAKYYSKIRGMNYKQIAYYFFLHNYSDDYPNYTKRKYSKTYSALILPGNKEQKIHFSFEPKFNKEEYDFRVYEYYLDCKLGMQDYI